MAFPLRKSKSSTSRKFSYIVSWIIPSPLYPTWFFFFLGGGEAGGQEGLRMSIMKIADLSQSTHFLIFTWSLPSCSLLLPPHVLLFTGLCFYFMDVFSALV